MGCSCNKSNLLKTKNGRSTCVNCTFKHLGTAWLYSTMIETPGVTANDLLARARILHSESMQGYPHHVRFAIACLSTASDMHLRGGNIVIANRIKDIQKKLEEDITKLEEFSTNIDSTFKHKLTLNDVRAQLLEAIEECPFEDAEDKIRHLLPFVDQGTFKKAEFVIADIIEVLHLRIKEAKEREIKNKEIESQKQEIAKAT